MNFSKVDLMTFMENKIKLKSGNKMIKFSAQTLGYNYEMLFLAFDAITRGFGKRTIEDFIFFG